MENGELEVTGCRTFSCPSLSLIDEKGKELRLGDATIKKAKDMAIGYLKKTYRDPHYSSFKHLLPSFVYIASILDGNKIQKKRVGNVFGTAVATINKWNKDIIDELCLKVTDTGRSLVSDEPVPEVKFEKPEFVCPDLSEMDKSGKILGLKDSTIEKAKELGSRYFGATYQTCPYNNGVSYVFPALIYIAIIIENDRRKSQESLEMILGAKRYSVSGLMSDIVKVLGLKIVRNDNFYIESISE